jgi:hypothetical protein
MRSRGAALSMAMLAMEALTGRPQRLLWCVDILRDVAMPLKPSTAPEVLASGLAGDEINGAFGALLTRLKSALDRLRDSPSTCRFAVVVRYADAHGGEPFSYTMNTGYRIDVVRIAGGPPPAGVWRVFDAPLPHNDEDVPPPEWWTDVIPF